MTTTNWTADDVLTFVEVVNGAKQIGKIGLITQVDTATGRIEVEFSNGKLVWFPWNHLAYASIAHGRL